MFVNKHFEEWLCMDRNDVIGKSVHDIYPEAQAIEFDALDREVLASGKVGTREVDVSYPDGNTRTIVGIRFPVISSKGGVLGLGIVNHDITARKRAERELAEKEAQLRVALDNMPGGMVLLDRDLNYVLFNSQYNELYEFPDGLVRVGGPLLDLLRYLADRGDFGPGNKDGLVGQVLDDYQSGKAVRERTFPGGRTIRFNMAPTPEGGYVTIHTDITERKRAEEQLLEAKQRSEEASKLVAEKNRMLESLSNQLSKYLSPQVYATIFSGDQSVEIASKRKKLTVFFSDIADFAGTTDSLESEELTNLLNHYLTEMSKIALDYGATIDKYVGDAIIAFFGDPETRGVKEDARTCVNMAIAMQRRMLELRSEWLDMGLERPFQLRIGINTGFCTVGNFGSADRMDYTIIGNEVNLAARLESLAGVGRRHLLSPFGEGRWRLHDLLRAAAAERLTEDLEREQQLWRRLGPAAVVRLEEINKCFISGDGAMVLALATMDQELPLLRGVQSWAAGKMERDRVAAEVASRLPNYVITTLRLGRDELTWREAALCAAEHRREKAEIARAAGTLGLVYRHRGDYSRAEAMHLRSLAIAEALGDSVEQAKQRGNLGLVYDQCGRLDEAEEMLEASIAIFEELGDRAGAARNLGNLGLVYQHRGKLDQAKAMHQRSLLVAKEFGNLAEQAHDLDKLGVVYRDQGELEQAQAMHLESLAIEEKLGNQPGQVQQINNIGLVHRNRGEWSEAAAHFGRALALAEDLSMREADIIRKHLAEAEARLSEKL